MTIAKDVKIQVEFNPNKVGAYRLIGYENRLLQKEDFNDDRKDAGEIGAGHHVTALHELVPPGKESEQLPNVDPLKYQRDAEVRKPSSDESLTVKLRYKHPEADQSQLVERGVTDSGTEYARGFGRLQIRQCRGRVRNAPARRSREGKLDLRRRSRAGRLGERSRQAGISRRVPRLGRCGSEVFTLSKAFAVSTYLAAVHSRPPQFRVAVAACRPRQTGPSYARQATSTARLRPLYAPAYAASPTASRPKKAQEIEVVPAEGNLRLQRLRSWDAQPVREPPDAFAHRSSRGEWERGEKQR